MQNGGEKTVRKVTSSSSDDSFPPPTTTRPWSPRLLSVSPTFRLRGPKKYSHLRLSPTSEDDFSIKDEMSMESAIPNPFAVQFQQETSTPATATLPPQRPAKSLPSPSSDARRTRSPIQMIRNNSPQMPLSESRKNNINIEERREENDSPGFNDGVVRTVQGAIKNNDDDKGGGDAHVGVGGGEGSVESRNPTGDGYNSRSKKDLDDILGKINKGSRDEHQQQPSSSTPETTARWNSVWGLKKRSPLVHNGSPYDTRSIADDDDEGSPNRAPPTTRGYRPNTGHVPTSTTTAAAGGGGASNQSNKASGVTPIFRVQTTGIEATFPKNNNPISTGTRTQMERNTNKSREKPFVLNVDTTARTTRHDDEEDDFTELIISRQESVKSGGGVGPSSQMKSSNELLRLCANIRTIDDVIRAQSFMSRCSTDKDLIADCVLSTDRKGRTPLHVFSENKDLATAIGIQSEIDYDTREEYMTVYLEPTFDLESNLEKHVVRFLKSDLLASNPGAMMCMDIDGKIPFESVLTQWIAESDMICIQNNSCSETETGYLSSVSRALGSRSTSILSSAKPGAQGRASSVVGEYVSGVTSNITGSGKDSWNDSVGSSGAKNSSTTTTRGTDRITKSSGHPQSVCLTPHVRFAIMMLSAVVNQLNHYMSPELFKSKSSRVQKKLGCESQQEFQRVLRFLSPFRDLYGSVDIGSVVVQTIASIPNLMRTILLLQDEGDREFLLSTPIIRRVMICKHSIGPWFTNMLQSRDRVLSQRSIEYLRAVSNAFTISEQGGLKSSSKETGTSTQFIDELSRLQDFIPALLALGDRGIEEASTTLIVQKILDRIISRPFAVTVVLCDAFFLALMILGFRSAVNKLILGESFDVVLQWIYVCNTGIFYFVIREIGKTVSLFLISKRARLYFFSFWNVIDLLAVGLTLASTITVRYHVTFNDLVLDQESTVRGLLAVTTGFLWLRVLSLLKAINMQLACFVLAIIQITKDIVWFCVILLTLVVSFAQMFFTLLAPTSCASDGAGEDECKPAEYLLRVYTILLGDFGDFEREQFTSAFSVFLVVFYSFLVTIVLLNILIAVASDSYEKCLVRSSHLFGRARVMLIAELVSFQNLLSMNPDGQRGKSRVYRTCGRLCCQNWSRGSILFFGISTLVVIGWTLAELLGYASGNRYGSILFSLASVIVNVLLFTAIMIFLAKGAASTTKAQSEGVDENVRSDSMIQKAMLRLLGTSCDLHVDGRKAQRDVDNWNGRVDYLQREMSRIVEVHSKSTENLVRQSESRLRNELSLLGENFGSLKSHLFDEVKESKSANAKVTMAVAELKTLISMAASSSVYRTPVPSEIDFQNTRFVRNT